MSATVGKETNDLALSVDVRMPLALDGVKFENSRLVFERDLTKDELRNLLSFTIRANDASLWWSGDTLALIFEKYGEEVARECAKQFKDATAAWSAMRLSMALEGQRSRFAGLSYRHHQAAMDECQGDAKEAIRWLQMASREKWEVSEMRARIRRARAGDAEAMRGKASVSITRELKRLSDRVKSVIEGRPVSEWNSVEVDAFLDEAEPLAEIFADVKKRWDHFNPEFPGIEAAA